MPSGSEQSSPVGAIASGTPDVDRASALLRSARRGSRSAFEQFSKLFLGRLHAFAARLTGDAELADDIVQDVLVRAYFKAPDRDVNLERWLFVVTRNAALNAKRHRGRRRELSLGDAPEPVAQRCADDAEADERRVHVAAALAELPEEQRAAIVLAKYHGHSCGRIAEVLGCSVSAVKMRISRGMQRLRTTLADLNETGGM